MLPLREEELKSHEDARNCYICGRRVLRKLSKSINYNCQVRNHCHYTGKYKGAAHNISNEIPVVFHNGSNHDYHFIIKELANEFEEKFECLGENTEKNKTFSIPMEKEVIKIDKDENGSVITISLQKKLLVVQDLWQLHYQILLIIPQKKFTKLNVKIVVVFFNMSQGKLNKI